MSRGTPTTPFRIPPALKTAAQDVARANGETLTAVVIRALEEYVTTPPRADATAPPPPDGEPHRSPTA